MIGQIAADVLSKAQGKKLHVILEERTGISAKTWKNGGPTSESAIESARVEGKTRTIKYLQGLGYSRAQIEKQIALLDQPNTGCWFLLTQIGLGIDDYRACPVTEECAREIDQLHAELVDLLLQDDLVAAQELLFDSNFLRVGKDWVRLTGEELPARHSPSALSSGEQLRHLMACVFGIAIFRFMACWDLEFFSKYFCDRDSGRALEPKPVFSWLLPDLKPGVMMDELGQYDSRGLFRLPLRKLIELSCYLGLKHRTKEWASSGSLQPDYIAGTGGDLLQGASKEAKNRPMERLFDGTRALSYAKFEQIWCSMCDAEDFDKGPADPAPLYVAAQVWTKLLIRNESSIKYGRPTVLFSLQRDAYRYWWDHWKAEFEARGTKFGSLPWPDYSVMT